MENNTGSIFLSNVSKVEVEGSQSANTTLDVEDEYVVVLLS